VRFPNLRQLRSRYLHGNLWAKTITMKTEISKEQFDAYVGVQESGHYNMFDPRARELANEVNEGICHLSREDWIAIISDYEALYERYAEGRCDECNQAPCDCANRCDLCIEPMMDCICEHNGSDEWANSEPYDPTKEYDC